MPSASWKTPPQAFILLPQMTLPGTMAITRLM